MNDFRRNQLKEVKALLTESCSKLSDIIDGEEDAINSVPENLQGSVRFERMEQNADYLNDALSRIDEALSLVADVR